MNSSSSRTGTTPFKAFPSAVSDKALAVFMDERVCRLDAWSKAYRDFWTDLRCDAAHADLGATMSIAHTDNIAIETNWASVRRGISAKSVMTFAPKLCSADFVITHARLHQIGSLYGAAAGGSALRAKGKFRKAWRQAKIRAKAKAKTACQALKRRSPDGGAVRAYISKRGRLGHKGRIDFALMGRGFNALPEDEKAGFGGGRPRRARIAPTRCREALRHPRFRWRPGGSNRASEGIAAGVGCQGRCQIAGSYELCRGVVRPPPPPPNLFAPPPHGVLFGGDGKGDATSQESSVGGFCL